jgi:DNA sulfur modification protein DndD
MIIDDIKNIFKPKNIDENFEPIHLLSYPEEERLKNIIDNIINYDIENIINDINLINKIQNDISKLNKKLKLNKENTDLKDILNQIEEKNIEIGRLKEKKENLEDKIIEQEENLEKISDDKENKFNELKNIKKEINIPLICEKIDSVLNQFIHIQLKEKIAVLEEKFLDIINKLISIENYIDDINIDINDFSITIYGANNQKLNNLSSGEQELVILSLLWSLSELSKREYPLVFDTLLGRIDEKHRNNIIEFLLAKSKRQIIILSTDSEIDQNHYNKIAPYIERDYLIFKKDKINHKSIIEENFFYEKEKVI